MGYNRDDLIRIKAEYREKYQKARGEADMRAEKIYMQMPRVKAIDVALSRTALEIMSAVTSGKENAEEALARVRARNAELMEERGKLLLSAGYPEDYTDVHYDCEKNGATKTNAPYFDNLPRPFYSNQAKNFQSSELR